jgi:hypothetical protein
MMPATNPLRLPDFIGVGPPRTATTWLHEVLSGHVGLPEGVKETDFFAWQYNKGLAWYAAHFRNCPADRPIGEFSPNYFVGAHTRERIAKDIPGCKMICTLRDPVERTYSHYRKMREGEYFSGSFEECLEKRPDILEWSKYATHVKAWQGLFGSQNVLVILQDDLKSKPQEFVNQVCDFIPVRRFELPDYMLRDRTVNAIPSLPNNPGLARIARIVRDGLQKRSNYAVVNLLKKTGMRNFLFGGGAAFEPLRPETDARLREFYRQEVEALEEMLGRDLFAWKLSRCARHQVSGISRDPS